MRIAALDLGSNSFHLLVADARAEASFVPILREKEMLRLGDVVATSGRITAEAADRAVDSVKRLRSLAEAAGAEQLVTCATSAIREAVNGGVLIERLAAEAGVQARVIDGEEEARLIFGAVRASVLIDPGPAVCLDLGGGSLEVMVGDSSRLLWCTSVQLGVARLTAELVRADPPRGGDVRRLDERLRSVLGAIAEEVATFEPRCLIGTSGTLTDLARMAVAQGTGAIPVSVNQLTVSRGALEAVHEQLFSLSAAERRRLPGLDSRRADLVPAGSLLALVAMELFGLEEMTIGEWALREGMVLNAIGHNDGSAPEGDPRLLRLASVVDLCRRCGWREVHSRQVARLALRLFDQTRPFHGLSDNQRELLEYAGFLHDIGEHVSAHAHHKHTAYLIEHGRLRGFSPEEVCVLGTMGRYHRQGEPKASFEPFAQLDARTRSDARTLTAFLRLADGLDRGHASAVDDIEAEVTDNRVRIKVLARQDAELELWGARRKQELFEDVFGRSLELCVEEAPAPPLWQRQAESA